MKRTHGELTGHIAGKVIDWLTRRWFSVTIAACAISVTYNVYMFVNRFLAFSWYLFESMEASKHAITGAF